MITHPLQLLHSAENKRSLSIPPGRKQDQVVSPRQSRNHPLTLHDPVKEIWPPDNSTVTEWIHLNLVLTPRKNTTISHLQIQPLQGCALRRAPSFPGFHPGLFTLK